MRHLLLCCVLAACDSTSSMATLDAAPSDTPPSFTPDTCNRHPITMVATPSWSPVFFGPVTIDTTGTTLCLSLDGQAMLAFSYFGAETASEPGTASSFTLEVRSAADVPLIQGQDLAYGAHGVTATVGLEVAPMQLVPIHLVARAKAVPAETWIRLTLIVPFD